MHDRDLLRDYVLNHSEQAFSQLVARHVDLVYATARRVVGEEHLAKDVVQLVFIKLARKAATVRDGDALAGWLYRVTCTIGYSSIRSELRRRKRENESMKLTEVESESPAAWATIQPLLDEAIQRLDAGEQDAVVLRFFEGKNLREAGIALGLSDDATQKRIRRALDKMRLYFSRHGVTTSVTMLPSLIATNSVQPAPTGLAGGVAGTALAKAGVVTGAAGWAAKLWEAKKIAALFSLLAVTIVVVVWVSGLKSPSESQSARPGPALPAAGASAAEGPKVETWEVPMMFTGNGSEAQFTLNSLRTAGTDTIVMHGLGVLTHVEAGYYLDYKISWQLFNESPPPDGKNATAKDDFEMQSSVTLQPNTPFVLWRAEGKILLISTDGKVVTIQLARPGGF